MKYKTKSFSCAWSKYLLINFKAAKDEKQLLILPAIKTPFNSCVDS